MWRIAERTGFVAAIMRYREKKPYQCRACGWLVYKPAKHLVALSYNQTICN
jgi:hypothetical protein